jgi:phosphonate degradation associated HDIG domain protein
VSDPVDEIFGLFARHGAGKYGEDVSLEAHMLQSATFAERRGAAPALVVAALLHDIGHFLYPDGEASMDGNRDLEHEALGAAWLSRLFDERVTAPIALHVAAKRYLCAAEPGYFDALSDASRASLILQGGPMTAEEAAAFVRTTAFEDAILLRRCDDDGKEVAMRTAPLDDYRDLVRALLRA